MIRDSENINFDDSIDAKLQRLHKSVVNKLTDSEKEDYLSINLRRINKVSRTRSLSKWYRHEVVKKVIDDALPWIKREFEINNGKSLNLDKMFERFVGRYHVCDKDCIHACSNKCGSNCNVKCSAELTKITFSKALKRSLNIYVEQGLISEWRWSKIKNTKHVKIYI